MYSSAQLAIEQKKHLMSDENENLKTYDQPMSNIVTEKKKNHKNCLVTVECIKHITIYGLTFHYNSYSIGYIARAYTIF